MSSATAVQAILATLAHNQKWLRHFKQLLIVSREICKDLSVSNMVRDSSRKRNERFKFSALHVISHTLHVSPQPLLAERREICKDLSNVCCLTRVEKGPTYRCFLLCSAGQIVVDPRISNLKCRLLSQDCAAVKL